MLREVQDDKFLALLAAFLSRGSSLALQRRSPSTGLHQHSNTTPPVPESFLRSHLCQVIEALLAQPGWRDVYARSQDHAPAKAKGRNEATAATVLPRLSTLSKNSVLHTGTARNGRNRP